MKVAREYTPTVIYVITKASWGGAQRYVWDLMQAAKNEGYTAILVYGEKGILSERAESSGFRTYPVGSLGRDISLFKDFQAFRDLYRIFSTFRPKIVHLNSSKASALGALAARLAGIKHIIFTAHAWAFTEDRSLLSKKILLLAHYVTVFLATHTIAVSDAIYTHTLRWPFITNKVHTIKNGVVVSGILSRNDARKILCEKDPTLDPSSLWIGTVAELHHNKGIDTGIDAFQHPKHLPAEWIIIGDGEEKHTLVAQSATLSHIHLLGVLPDAERYMSAFDIFFLPSRTEALGYVLLEAGAASIPSVATNVGGIPEVVIHEKTGLLVPSGDAVSMNSALLRLIEDTALRTELGNAMHDRVTVHFSKAHMVQETFALYRL